MTEKEIQDLALKFLKGQTTKEEDVLLHSWYESKVPDNGVKIVIKNIDNETFTDVRSRLFLNIQKEIKGEFNLRTRKNYFLSRRIYLAASIILILSVTCFYFYFQIDAPDKRYYTVLPTKDIGPGRDNAVLVLGDSIKINLDQAHIGNLAENNGLIVSKLADGMLALEISDSQKDVNQINIIQTPKGGQFRVKLPDGTQVWLNASSTIKFPSVFAEDSRDIELEGEGYFEVARIKNKSNKRLPFFVKSQQQKVEVLGTHFNVNSYPNEKAVKTTLVEGSVRIHTFNSRSPQLLIPGQQSMVYKENIDVKAADIESDIAWKNGDFVFNSENLQSIMRKIERWYDVEVEYKGIQDDYKFTGAVSRSKNLSEVLKIMELTGKVKFKIEGRRVIVMT